MFILLAIAVVFAVLILLLPLVELIKNACTQNLIKKMQEAGLSIYSCHWPNKRKILVG